MSLSKVQAHFGANARAYATSEVHAKGASLQRLVDLLQPRADWQVLDVATAAGHMALAVAPYVDQVTATDITPEMLPVAMELAEKRGIKNISVQTAAADDLPFEDNSFDLVTCRIAAHHFLRVDHFLAESARVLRLGGQLAVVDNIVPGSRLRGKKAKLQRAAGDYVNAFEKYRDTSHHRCLSLEDWQDAFADAGLRLVHQELVGKIMEFDPWAARTGASDAKRMRLRVMLKQAPAAAAEFLTPQFTGDRITFRLTEGLFIGRLERGEQHGLPDANLHSLNPNTGSD